MYIRVGNVEHNVYHVGLLVDGLDAAPLTDDFLGVLIASRHSLPK